MQKNSYKKRNEFTKNIAYNEIQKLVNLSLGLDTPTELNDQNFNEISSGKLNNLEMTRMQKENSFSNCSMPLVSNEATSQDLMKLSFKENFNIPEELISEEENGIKKLSKSSKYARDLSTKSQQCSENAENTDCLSNSENNSYLDEDSSDESFNFSEMNVLQDKSSILEKTIHKPDEILSTQKSEINNKNAKNVCPHCSKSFQYPSRLKKHIRIHNKYQNSKIDKSVKDSDSNSETAIDIDFSSEMSNSFKMKLSSKKRIHQCPACSKTFKHPSKLVRHIKTHVGIKPYVCDVCSTAFLEKQNLFAHKQVHSNEKQRICDVCQKVFLLKSNLTRHLRSHMKEKICNDCGIVCDSEKKLAFHVLHHQGKLHKCTHCEKEFRKKSNLKRHLETHSSIRKFPCNFCDYRAGRNYHLKRHIQRCHAE